MFNFIRRHRAVFMVIFILSGLGMIISMGLPGMGSNSVNPLDLLSFGSKAVAKVGTQEVSIQELQQDILRKDEQMRKMFSTQMNTEQGRAFYEQIRKAQLNPDKIVDEMVQRKIYFHLFDKQNMQISQGAIRSQLEELPYFKKNGAFDPALYKKLVSAPHVFENSLRDQLKSEKVMEPFAFLATFVTDAEVEMGRMMAKKKDFEVLQINPSVIKKDPIVNDADVAAVVADASKLNDLKAYYNKNIREYKKAEEISAKHILIKEEDGGEKKIKEIQDEIKTGKISFEEAAKKYSKDASNASKGGDLGFFAKGVMDKDFETAAFALKTPGEISDVIKSTFGYHLIKFTERKEGFEKKFEDVKSEVALKYAKDQKKMQQVKDLAQSWLKLKKGPESAQLKAYNLSWTKVPGWDVGQNRLGFLAEKDVQATELLALSKEKPLLNRVIEIPTGVVLVRWVGEKVLPVTLDELAYQKAARLTEIYFQRYRKTLEQDHQIKKSEKIIAQVKRSLQL
ncbi:MAG: peptidylprolyl isomerase [Bdellovibrionota bacterium]